jgi:hypothetical protein
MKNSSNNIGNRTHDLPVYSTVPQTTAARYNKCDGTRKYENGKGKGKAILLKAWTGSKASRKLRRPDLNIIGTLWW